MPLLSPQPVLIRLFCALALSATMLDVQAKTSPNTQTGAFVPFVGRWDGALEYKDYQGSGRVKVPVKLEVKLKDGPKDRLKDGNLASWNFVYDDFGKTVTSLETHSLVGKTYKVVTVGQKEVQTYTCDGFAALFSSGAGVAVLIGSELENGKTVEVRRTVTLSAGTLTTLKETRPAGATYTFRNQSTYTRAAR